MKKNNTWNIRHLVDESFIPVTQRIIWKIDGFLKIPHCAWVGNSGNCGLANTIYPPPSSTSFLLMTTHPWGLFVGAVALQLM